MPMFCLLYCYILTNRDIATKTQPESQIYQRAKQNTEKMLRIPRACLQGRIVPEFTLPTADRKPTAKAARKDILSYVTVGSQEE